jgi:hypothetical protein
MSAVQSGQEDFSGMTAYKLNQAITGARHHLPHCFGRDQAEHHALREERIPGQCARLACLLKPCDEPLSGGSVSLGGKELGYESHGYHGKRLDGEKCVLEQLPNHSGAEPKQRLQECHVDGRLA